MRSALFLLLAAGPGLADAPVIEAVEATATGATWRFDVTVRHADTGWEHYADGWRITAPDGTELGHRTLLHPHVEEQPFTRSLGGVLLPAGATAVVLQAHDSVHGWGEPFLVTLD